MLPPSPARIQYVKPLSILPVHCYTSLIHHDLLQHENRHVCVPPSFHLGFLPFSPGTDLLLSAAPIDSHVGAVVVRPSILPISTRDMNM